MQPDPVISNHYVTKFLSSETYESGRGNNKSIEAHPLPHRADLGWGPGPAPGLPPTRGLPPNPSIFVIMIDVSLVILIQDFEINEN